MGLFEPIWKTKAESKKNKAILSLQKINDMTKLNRIVLSAPLFSVRSAAVRRISDVAGKELPFDANESLRTLLLLDVDDIRELDWYSYPVQYIEMHCTIVLSDCTTSRHGKSPFQQCIWIHERDGT